MFRFKQLLGRSLTSRGIDNQKAETKAKCEALNVMERPGMPEGEWPVA
ncbi:MAG: hypothetical protein ACI9S8_000988 [Chlamydiales bacterium]|jgi:hypothetical protein